MNNSIEKKDESIKKCSVCFLGISGTGSCNKANKTVCAIHNNLLWKPLGYERDYSDRLES